MKIKNFITCLICLLTAVFILAGCGFLRPINDKTADSERSGQRRGPSPVYYDFDDILIPGEMKVNRRDSSVFQIENVSMGVLSLKGSIDTGVLIEFLKTNMAKDNWRLVGEFKAPRSLLLFEKENRWCVVATADERYGYDTRMDVWVAPKTGDLGSGLFK